MVSSYRWTLLVYHDVASRELVVSDLLPPHHSPALRYLLFAGTVCAQRNINLAVGVNLDQSTAGDQERDPPAGGSSSCLPIVRKGEAFDSDGEISDELPYADQTLPVLYSVRSSATCRRASAYFPRSSRKVLMNTSSLSLSVQTPSLARCTKEICLVQLERLVTHFKDDPATRTVADRLTLDEIDLAETDDDDSDDSGLASTSLPPTRPYSPPKSVVPSRAKRAAVLDFTFGRLLGHNDAREHSVCQSLRGDLVLKATDGDMRACKAARREAAVYERLSVCQGSVIPKFYGAFGWVGDESS
jgi:hypothetical protein